MTSIWDDLRIKLSPLSECRSSGLFGKGVGVDMHALDEHLFSPTKLSGATIRLACSLDKWEEKGLPIQMVFVAEFKGYTKEFMRGLFEKSIAKFNSKEDFDKIYDLGGSVTLRRTLNTIVQELFEEKK
jgi:hypothetical protein